MAKAGDPRRVVLLVAIMLAIGLAALVAAGWRERKATGRLEALAGESARAADLAGEVRRLQVAGRKAVEPSAESLNPAAFFERLAAAIGIAPESVKGIETRRVPQAKDSPYDELATMVRLAGVSQDKVGEFLQRIEKENPQYLVKEVRLVAGEGKGALWDATITVSLLVYRPDTIDTESP